MEYLLIQLCFYLRTAFHSTGNVRRPGVDKALARNAEGILVIPATSVKGSLRERAEVLLRTWGHGVCTGPEPGSMCDGQAPCLVCRVFGNPRNLSALRFSDAVPLVDSDATAVRSGVAISRHRRAAYPQQLFFVETTQPGPTQWGSRLEGYFSDARTAKTAASLVALAARWGTAIGEGKTRGLGWIEKIEVQPTLNGKGIPEEDLIFPWRTWKEAKDVAED